MKCHYEVLGLSETATADEIKKAYRKLALEWHPDKNLHREEEAKENFQLLQQAYEVLSDLQERAWYDRHREEILRGGFDNEYNDESLDVYQYFNSSCFKGFSDDEKSFYSVFRDVFQKISEEDQKFMDDGCDKMPPFGYSYSSYDEVHDFYAYWQSYCTAKSYTWVDKHDLTELRKASVGRQVLRAIEKENKKLRDQHKKARNEEVRQLVSFVRKRDKRLHAYQKVLEEQSAAKAKKFKEQQAQQILERQKNLQSYQETEWSSMAQFEEHLNEIESQLSENNIENDDDEDENMLYCVACDKDFRSLKSMKNHENSKKHKENVELLKILMTEEEKVVNNSEENYPDNTDESGGEDISETEILDDKDEDLSYLSATKKSSKKKKKRRKKAISEDEVNELVVEEAAPSTERIENELQVEEQSVVEVTDSTTPNKEQLEETIPKPKETKKKKIKSTVPVQPTEETDKQSTICEKCGRNYHSRNKLFQHLKETGHAMYLGEGEATKRNKNDFKKNISTKKRTK